MATSNKFVKLGPKASFFRDPVQGISVRPGETVELNLRQLNSGRVAGALRGGHLVYATVEEPKALSPEELRDSLLDEISKGVEDKKILKLYKKADLTAIAALYDIEVEESDKTLDILEAIKAEVNNN